MQAAFQHSWGAGLSSTFQTAMVGLHRTILPRGHSRLVRLLARFLPSLKTYPALLADGDRLYLDLRETMCLGYFFEGELPHERGLVELLKVTLRPGGSFVDVGSNVGFYARKAAALVGDTGRVVAFEPNPSAYRLLEWNTRDTPHVRILRNAAGAQRGAASFWVQEAGDTSSLLAVGTGREISVEILTLDETLADWSSVDLIKIDVEGAELDVLKGAETIIRRHSPVVVFEFLRAFAEIALVTLDDFRSFFAGFSEAGYELYALTRGASGEEPSGTASDFVAVPACLRARLEPLPFLHPVRPTP